MTITFNLTTYEPAYPLGLYNLADVLKLEQTDVPDELVAQARTINMLAMEIYRIQEVLGLLPAWTPGASGILQTPPGGDAGVHVRTPATIPTADTAPMTIATNDSAMKALSLHRASAAADVIILGGAAAPFALTVTDNYQYAASGYVYVRTAIAPDMILQYSGKVGDTQLTIIGIFDTLGNPLAATPSAIGFGDSVVQSTSDGNTAPGIALQDNNGDWWLLYVAPGGALATRALPHVPQIYQDMPD